MKALLLILLPMIIRATDGSCEAFKGETASESACKGEDTDAKELTHCCFVSYVQNDIEHKYCYVVGKTDENKRNYKRIQLKEMSKIKIVCASESRKAAFISLVALIIFLL